MVVDPGVSRRATSSSASRTPKHMPIASARITRMTASLAVVLCLAESVRTKKNLGGREAGAPAGVIALSGGTRGGLRQGIVDDPLQLGQVGHEPRPTCGG